MATPVADRPEPSRPSEPPDGPYADFSSQFRAAYRTLETWKPGEDRSAVVWATGVVEAQHAEMLSRFWHTGNPQELHGPWGFHVLGHHRMFQYDRCGATIYGPDDGVIARVDWAEVAALLDAADSDVRYACDEALLIRDRLAELPDEGSIVQDAKRASRWYCFRVAAAAWESVRPDGVASALVDDEDGASS